MSSRRRGQLAAIAVAALMVALVAILASRSLFRAVVCDAWTVELRDGTVLYAPGYFETAEHSGFGPCWTLPAGITLEDFAY